jgi:hypothetical protein
VKFAALILTILASIPLSAQDPPYPLVFICREQVKPGRLAKVVQIEESAAQFCAKAGCPNPYVALTSITGRDEIWWVNGFDSAEAMEKTMRDYAANTQITDRLAIVAESKAGFVFPAVNLIARFREDLSISASTTFAYARYISATVVQVRPGQTPAYEKARQAVKAAQQRSGRTQWTYQVTSGIEDGTYLILTPGRTLQEVRVVAASEEHTDAVTSSVTRLYAVSPGMSMPAQSWLASDPDFWKRP